MFFYDVFAATCLYFAMSFYYYRRRWFLFATIANALRRSGYFSFRSIVRFYG